MILLFALECTIILEQKIFNEIMTIEKNARYLYVFAVILMIFSGTLMLYTWFNYDRLKEEQTYRLMWHLNSKHETAPSY